jgi:signal transduction histidine kinase
MSRRKPSLAVILVRRHLWFAALTSFVVMLALLALADLVNMRMHRQALLKDLHNIETIDAVNPPSLGIYSKISYNHVNYTLLDGAGHWDSRALPPAQQKPSRFTRPWPLAPTILKAGQLDGKGQLPWVADTVIWAACKVVDPDGEPMILVAWYRVSAIRAASNFATYGIIIAAILIAFLVNALMTLGTARYITRIIHTIAQSGTQMAAGNLRVRLPNQPTEELERVSTALTNLAEGLDQTTIDLQAEHERLRRMELLQRQFVADASHELRAPLTSMRVMLEAWQDGVIRPEEQGGTITLLLSETERLGTLVTRLLDLSRIESGRETVSLTTVALAPVVARVQNIFHDLPGAPIIADLPTTLPLLLADEDALLRILHNLLENARRFTPADGSIRIAVRVEDAAVCVRVSDTGCGIMPEDLPRIWDRFARAAEARAQGKAGSGLGLAIVKGLSEAMGAQVGAESIAGQGATFWVRLRIAEEP